MSQKSYDNTPTLYIVPTPIGNMDDITMRAINVLQSVDAIFSEDTRVTLNLLNHFQISKKLISLYKFNEVKSSEKLLDYLKSGKSIALVSDRGTPILSDPGNICAKMVINAGYNVVSLPGATAAIPALTSSGLDANKFLFYGFLNSKSTQRRKELEKIKNVNYTIVFYEAPHRITQMLDDLYKIFGNRDVSISREISKKHEEIYRGSLSDVISQIKEPKGEFVVVVSGNNFEIQYDEITIKEHFDIYVSQGYSEMEAIKMVAKDRKVTKNQIYKEIKLFPGK